MDEGLTEYETEELEITLSGINFRLLRVTNTDSLYSALVAKGQAHEDVKDERIPYWADLWPSALALAMEVLENPAVKAGVKVLEIGCGLALPGIAAGKKGAEVILTDYLPAPLIFARLNWKKNLESEPVSTLLDWRKPGGFEPCDILLASDVAYEKRAFEYLEEAFRKLVKPQGVILLTEPRRLMALPFLSNLASKGFKVESSLRVVTLNGRKNEVNVYEIRQKMHK